jgi:hypothetical protein
VATIGIGLGLVRDKHLAMLYSPYGLAEGMDGLKTWDARRLAINAVLYLMH